MCANERRQPGDQRSLAEAVLLLQSPERVIGFLRDLLSEREVSNLNFRWRIISSLSLLSNDVSPCFKAIAKELGCSPRTVSRAFKEVFKSGSGVAKEVAADVSRKILGEEGVSSKPKVRREEGAPDFQRGQRTVSPQSKDPFDRFT